MPRLAHVLDRYDLVIDDARRVLDGQRRSLPRGYSASVRSMTDGLSFKRPADARRLADGLRLAGLN